MENIRVLDLSPWNGVGRSDVQYAKQPLHSDRRSYPERCLRLKLYPGSIPHKGQTRGCSIPDTGHHGGSQKKEVLTVSPVKRLVNPANLLARSLVDMNATVIEPDGFGAELVSKNVEPHCFAVRVPLPVATPLVANV